MPLPVICNRLIELVRSGEKYDHLEDVAYETHATSPNDDYLKPGATAKYNLEEFITEDSDANEMFDSSPGNDDDIPSGDDLAVTYDDTPTLIKTWYALITIKNIHSAQISAVGDDQIKTLQENLCTAIQKLEPKILTTQEKCINDSYGGNKTRYKNAKKACKSTDTIEKKWSDSDCKCNETPIAQVVTSDKVGCLDPRAINYWCDIQGNDCTSSGGPPEGMQNSGCKYKSRLTLIYNYAFCKDKKGCTNINLDPGTHKIISYSPKRLLEMYQGFKALVQSVADEGYSVSSEKVFLPFVDAPSFYGTPSTNDIKDLARALTIQTKATCDDYTTFPFTYVTMYGTDGITPMGQFKIVRSENTEASCLDRIEKLIPWESSLTTRDRVINMLQNDKSANTPLELDLTTLAEYRLTIDQVNKIFTGWGIPVYVTAEGYVKYTGSEQEIKKDDTKDDGDFDISQYQRLYNSIEGLNNVLFEKPEGLVNILK